MGLLALLLRGRGLATGGVAPGVLDVRHNISPRLRKQLVLELKVGVSFLELIEALPSGIVFSQAVPLDQHAPDTTATLRLQCAFGSRKDAPVLRRR